MCKPKAPSMPTPPPPVQAPKLPTPKQAGRRNPLAPLPAGGLVGDGLLTGTITAGGMGLGVNNLYGGGRK